MACYEVSPGTAAGGQIVGTKTEGSVAKVQLAVPVSIQPPICLVRVNSGVRQYR